jgi:hypothetical protein
LTSSAPALALFTLPAWLEAEVRWYLSGAGGVESVISSSFGPLVNMAMAGFGSARSTSDGAIDAANKLVGDSRKAWKISRWLGLVGKDNKAVLLAHYGPTPPRLDALGEWAGVARLCPSYRQARGKGGRDLESLCTRFACGKATKAEKALIGAIKVDAFRLVACANFALRLLVEGERSPKRSSRKAG